MAQIQAPLPHRPARWGRRILLGIFALFFILLLLHAFWDWSVDRRLKATITALKARGEPTTAADLVNPVLPDADNAVIELRAAQASINRLTPAYKAFLQAGGSPDEWPYTPEELARVRGILDENQAALKYAAAAYRKPGVDWQIDPKTPPLDLLLPTMNMDRELANLLRDAAREAHIRGDDALAIDRLFQLMRLARAIDERPGGLVVHLVANGCTALATNCIEELSCELMIEPQTATTRPSSVATRKQIKALLHLLADEAPQHAGWRRGMQGERVFNLELSNAFLNGKSIGGTTLGAANSLGGTPWQVTLKTYALRPIIQGDVRLLVNNIDAAIAAGEQPDRPSALKALGNPNAVFNFDNQKYLHFWAAILGISFERAIQTDFKTLTERRFAATALAIRLFTIDHEGHFPQTLDELVPEYLPAVPLDPMAAHSPLRYLPRKDDPILYSVGTNGKDDNGSEKSISRFNREPGRWEREDTLVHLTPQPRKTPKE